MSVDVFHVELLLLPTGKRSDARGWGPAQVLINSPGGLALRDQDASLVVKRGAVAERSGENACSSFYYTLF